MYPYYGHIPKLQSHEYQLGPYCSERQFQLHLSELENAVEAHRIFRRPGSHIF
jgi:hypothetical protein